MTPKKNILFDGDCSFCNYWVRFILKRDTKKQFEFLPLESKKGKELREQYHVSVNLDTLILIHNNKASIKSSAALHIAKQLKFPWFLFYGLIIIPPFIRNWIYDLIAKNRHKLFKTNNNCELPPSNE